MKKTTVCVIALAAMTFAMTSCNKEEGNVTETINAFTESNELLNEVKTHTVQDSLLYWDEGDQILISDASNNSAYYEAMYGGGNTTFRFLQNTNNARPFDANNGTLTAVYPKSLGIYTGNTKINLPATQWTNTGDVENFPMVGLGALNEFRFRNACGVFRMILTYAGTIDSISITTDKYVSGYFSVNFDNENPLSYYVTYNNFGHGSKTATLKFRHGLVNAANQKVNIYLPAAEYNVFDITFYSGNTKLVKRNNSNITISRTQAQQVSMTLNEASFATYNKGVTAGTFMVAASSAVRLATGNLQFIAQPGATAYWRIADNQFDTYTTSQTGVGTGHMTADRDIFAFGANGNGYQGNSQLVWGGTQRFDAAETFDFTCNLGNAASGMRALTNAEWEYLLAHQTHATVTFNGVNGLMILPHDCTLTLTEGATLSKHEYNTYMVVGAAFLPINKYRNETGRRNGIYTYASVSGTSYYWTATSGKAVNANNATVDDFAANNGAYVRLALDVE